MVGTLSGRSGRSGSMLRKLMWVLIVLALGILAAWRGFTVDACISVLRFAAEMVVAALKSPPSSEKTSPQFQLPPPS